MPRVCRRESFQTQVFWVHAGNTARFEQSYGAIASVAMMPSVEEPTTNILGLVYRWLESDESGDWLMVLDSADDLNVFFPRPSARTASTLEGN